jgi:hypothetical protein
LFQQAIHFVMLANVQIGGVLFKVVTNMKIVECTGYDGHACMGSDGFTGERKFGFSLPDDFTWTAFLAILFSHPFDDSFLVDWPRLTSQNHY